MNNKLDSVLGQKVASPETYAPDILVREERQNNRSYLGIKDDNLPFIGYDIWNGYECSTLNILGLPVTCIAKVVYPSNSKYIVESKSMKLYWNSFNMTTFFYFRKKDILKCLKEIVIKDLSTLLETDVKVELYSQMPGECLFNNKYAGAREDWENQYCSTEFVDWVTLEEHPDIDIRKLVFDKFTEDSNLLVVSGPVGPGTMSFNYRSCLLRSNCKITKQPDSGDIYIYHRGNKTVTPESLLKWIVSLRNECHFHEEICELAYKRLWDAIQPKELAVTCFYARRGGWDIVPTRVSHKSLLDKDLINPRVPYFKFPKQ